MPRFAAVLIVLIAVFAPHADTLAKERRPAPKLQIKTSQEPSAAVPGRPVSLDVILTPPEGIVLNRYPGIKLVFESSPGLRPSSPEVFLGSREPIEDPDRFYFNAGEPLKLEVVAEKGKKTTRTLRGDLTYFYCVKASGFCAPARQKLELPVKVAAD